MADDQQNGPAQEVLDEAEQFWVNDPTGVPEYYVNRYVIDEGPSDVSLVLGSAHRDRDRDGFPAVCKVRLIMSHDYFLRFADEAAKEAALLKALYKGNAPSLREVDSEEYNAALMGIYYDDNS